MIGEVLAGRYEVEATISRGGQATVLRAIDRQHDRVVALKVYAFDGDAERDALLVEARSLLGVAPHPSLPRLRDDFFVETRYVVVMDWVDGRDLATLLREEGDPGLDRSVVVDCVDQVAAALDHLHAQHPPIVHGDVKPANVIRDPDGGITLVDFGIAVTNQARRRAGTRGYLAPEVAAEGLMAPAADVYGLAATAAALLTGRPPDGSRPMWDGIDPAEVGPLARALRRGLATDPTRRPASAGAFAERLRAGRFGALPRGVVTFLSTDVADAAALWDASTESMVTAVDRLEDVVADVVDQYGGRLLPSMGGDAWLAAFTAASPAASAALELHKRVATEHWPSSLPVRLRVALHSGEAAPRDGEYHGRTVHVVGRLLAAAPAAGTVLSQAARELLSPAPDSASMFDLVVPESSDVRAAAGSLFGIVERGQDPFVLQPCGRADHPAGAVWMLCTDVENSTRLLQTSPERYRKVMDRYRRVLAEICADVDGTLLSTVEDIAVIAVSDAVEAISAAIAGQRAFESTQPDLAMRVRMGIHAEQVAGDPLESAHAVSTRTVLAVGRAGHGGQVLVSEQARRLAIPALAAGVSLLDIGTHRLGDLPEPLRLYQLAHPDLAADFPPPRSLAHRAHNLPAQLTRFIGREDEVTQLIELLAGNRLCTITGIGGAGKTRLALEVAAETLPLFPEGVWVADLAGVADGDAVVTTVNAELGVREGGSGTYAAPRRQLKRSAVDRLVDHLEFGTALVVLDNCEHVLDACAELVDALLRRCRRVRVLATSREALGIAGEVTYRLGPLALPPPSADLAEARECSSVRLFVDRALLRRPALSFGDAEIAEIATICRRVDGIPFAIELAAARVSLLGVGEIASALGGHLGLLAASRSSSARQPTLRAMIEWSHDLLSEREQTVLRRLSVFAGGFDLEAASHVCAGETLEGFDVLELLAALVDKSLLETEPAVSRFRLLEVTRQFAADRLGDAGEDAVVRAAHLGWYVSLAERAETELTGADQGRWLELLEADHDNLLVALASGRDAGGGDDARLAASVSHYWLVRGRLSEGRTWLDCALLARSLPDALRAKTLCALGMIECFAGDYDRAVEVATEGRAIARRLASRRWEARAEVLLGLAASGQGRPAEAEQHHRSSVESSRAVGDRWLCTFALTNLGNVLSLQGATAEARCAYEESLALRRAMGDVWGMTWALFRLGVLATSQGRFDEAEALLRESLERASSIGFGQGVLLARMALGEACQAAGQHGDAREWFEGALTTARQLEEDTGAGIALAGLASAAVADAELGAASRWLSEPEAGPDDDQRAMAARAALLRARALLAAARGDDGEARSLHSAALVVRQALGDQRAILDEVDALAIHAVARAPQVAEALFAASDRWRSEMGFPVPPRDQAARDAAIARLRSGGASRNAETSAGDDLTVDDAIRLARHVAADVG